MPDAPIIVLGSGLAGHAVARAIRSGGHRRRLLMVTAEDGHFYSKPALSVSFSRRTASDALVSRAASQVCAELGIELWARRHVTAIDRTARRLLLVDGELQREGSVVNLVAHEVRPLPEVAATAGGPEQPGGVRQLGHAGMRRLG